MASLSVFQGIGLMVLAYSIAEPVGGVLTAAMWMLVIVPTLLRLRGHSSGEDGGKPYDSRAALDGSPTAEVRGDGESSARH